MEILINSLEGIFDGYDYHQGPKSIRIENGLITEIIDGALKGPSLDGRGKILSSPFNDAHTHLIFAGERFSELGYKLSGLSYNDILAKGGGIRKTMELTRQASNDEIKSLLTHRLDTMLTHGTLFTEIKSGYGLSIEEEIRHLEILNSQEHYIDISPTFGGAHVPPPDYDRNKYIEDITDEMLPFIKKKKLAETTDVFCDKGAFNVGEAEIIFSRSLEFGIPIRVHAEELVYTGIGKIASSKYKARSADHLLKAKLDDFRVYERNETVATFMPLAPFGLFTNDKPEGWKNTGVTIGLGSDFNPNNWIISMQTAMRMAVFKYLMHPLSAFRAATSGSYQSITGKKMERLNVGSTATFLLLNAHSLDEFIAKIGQNLVSHVIKKGEVIVENKSPIV